MRVKEKGAFHDEVIRTAIPASPSFLHGYGAIAGALASGFAIVELHHHSGPDLL